MFIMNEAFIVTLFFEQFLNKIKICLSAKNSNNQVMVLSTELNSQWLQLLRSNLHTYTTSLVDITGLDLTKLTNYAILFNTSNWNFKLQHYVYLVYFNLISYSTTQRLIYACFLSKEAPLYSVSDSFHNAVWLERELVEFFGISVSGRTDTRNLLLDYNLPQNPLLKSFPTEGTQEVFFNYLTYNLDYVQTEFIEL